MRLTACVTGIIVGLIAIPLLASAASKDNGESERRAIIDVATKLYSSFIQKDVPELADYKNFGKSTAKRLFQSSSVIKLNSGHVIYNPMNGITFVLVREGKKTRTLYGLSPSELFSLTGRPTVKADDFHIRLLYDDIPGEIDKFVSKTRDLSPVELKAFLAKADGTTSVYRQEKAELIVGPYLRAEKYKTCLSQLDAEKVKKKLRTDLMNSGDGVLLKHGFDMVDFVPLNQSEAVAIQASRLGGFYVFSRVAMKEKCSVQDTWYRLI